MRVLQTASQHPFSPSELVASLGLDEDEIIPCWKGSAGMDSCGVGTHPGYARLVKLRFDLDGFGYEARR